MGKGDRGKKAFSPVLLLARSAIASVAGYSREQAELRIGKQYCLGYSNDPKVLGL
jgi:hypothetical protein